MHTMANPIFILGHHRSGTTWLTNQLSEHADISAVRHIAHKGVHESIFFSHIYGRYGDLDDPNNFIEFVEAFGTSDYVTLAGISKSFLYSLRPTTYEDCFRALMDRHAAEHGADYWLEKSPAHTLIVFKLNRMFPDARFIAITRGINEVIPSCLRKFPAGSDPHSLSANSLFRHLWTYMYYGKALRCYAARHRNLYITSYKTLVDNYCDEMQAIEEFIGVPHSENVCSTAYAPDSSFTNETERKLVLPFLLRLFIPLLPPLTKFIPWYLFRVVSVFPRLRRRNPRLPEWFYKLHRQKLKLNDTDNLEKGASTRR